MKASNMFRGKQPVARGTRERSEYHLIEAAENELGRVLSRRAGIPLFKLELKHEGEPPAMAEPTGDEAFEIEEYEAGKGASGLTGIEKLFAPLSNEEFFQAQYERTRPMLFHGPGDRFSDLMSWKDFNEIMNNKNLNLAQFRVVQEGNTIQPEMFSHFSGSFGARSGSPWVMKTDAGKLETFVRNGATIIINSIQTLHEPIRALIADVEKQLATYAGVNLYASWRHTRGFTNHWDDHDVFIIQVTGEKIWHLWGEMRAEPWRRDVEPNIEEPPAPLWSGTLTQGDVLYIPRGWWHCANVSSERDGEGSIHLTLSPHTFSGREILGWIEGKLAEHRLARQNVPLYARSDSLREYLQEFGNIVEQALREASDGTLVRDLQDTWQERTLSSYGSQIDPWQSQHWLSCKVGIKGIEQARVLHDSGDGKTFTLLANGYEHEFDSHCLEIVQSLLNGRRMTVNKLVESLQGSYSREFINDFLVKLIKEDILAVGRVKEG